MAEARRPASDCVGPGQAPPADAAPAGGAAFSLPDVRVREELGSVGAGARVLVPGGWLQPGPVTVHLPPRDESDDGVLSGD